MNRHRGAAALLVTLFTLVVLGIALYVLSPRRDLRDIQSHVGHTLGNGVEGLLQHVPSFDTLLGTPWGWAAILGLFVVVLAFVQRGPGR